MHAGSIAYHFWTAYKLKYTSEHKTCLTRNVEESNYSKLIHHFIDLLATCDTTHQECPVLYAVNLKIGRWLAADGASLPLATATLSIVGFKGSLLDTVLNINKKTIPVRTGPIHPWEGVSTKTVFTSVCHQVGICTWMITSLLRPMQPGYQNKTGLVISSDLRHLFATYIHMHPDFMLLAYVSNRFKRIKCTQYCCTAGRTNHERFTTLIVRLLNSVIKVFWKHSAILVCRHFPYIICTKAHYWRALLQAVVTL